MNRIDHNATAGRLDEGVAAVQWRTGSLSGEQVMLRPKDAVSVLEDAREEISMHHSEKVEAKEFSEREIGGTLPSRRMRIEQLEAYREATRRFEDQAELAALVRLMQAGTRPGDVARGASDLAADQFVLLQFALHDARRRGMSADVLERLDETIADLEADAGAEIRAGLNTVQVAASFSPTAQGVRAFQKAYTDIVLGQESLSKTLDIVLQRLSGPDGEEFDSGLRSLLNALGADLKASAPSADTVRLQALVQDVYQLEVVGSLLEECRRLSVAMSDRLGLPGMVPLALMQEIVAVINERWVTPQRLRAMAEKFLARAMLARIAFHTGTRNVLRRIPVKVFHDLDSRQGLLDAVQVVLDEAVAEEEEGEGA